MLFRSIPFRDEGLQILAYGREFILKGQVARALVPVLLKLLDGHSCVEEICKKAMQEVDPPVSQDVLTHTLKTLEQYSIIQEQTPDVPFLLQDSFREQLDFFSVFEKNAFQYQSRLQQGHLGLFVVGPIAEPFLRSLRPLGIGKITLFSTESELKEPLGEGIVHCPLKSIDYEHLEEIIGSQITYLAGASLAITHRLWQGLNRAAIALKIPMTRLEISPLSAEIGPTVLPGSTACYHCFELRKASLKTHYEEYENLSAYLKNNESLPHFAVHPLFRETACNLAAYEVMRVMSRYFYPQTYNQVLSLNFFSLEIEKNTVLKIPRCPVCSAVAHKPMKERYEREYAGETV